MLSEQEKEPGWGTDVGKSMMAKIGVFRLQWFHSQVRGAVTQAAELAQLRGQQGGGKYNRKIKYLTTD